MSPADVTAVIDTYAAETAALGARYRWVQAFENKGELMGCSNPHPHGQIWASDALPNEAAAEDQHQRAYAAAHGTRLLADYARLERARGERVVHQSASWVAVVPYWAVWPFETLILPLVPVARLPDVTPDARRELGELLVALLSAYDRLFDVSFPYSMGWHGAPFGDGADDARRLAAARARLPAAAAVGDGEEVHGRLRAAGRAAARSDARSGRGAPARARPLTRDRLTFCERGFSLRPSKQ